VGVRPAAAPLPRRGTGAPPAGSLSLFATSGVCHDAVTRPGIPIVGIIVCVGKNTSFSLDEHFSDFIETEVASGRYRSASDVVRTALRLLEDRETRLEALRQALVTGENSGTATPFDFDEFVSRKRAGGSQGR
jgi:antitoxin ParD1/3/4